MKCNFLIYSKMRNKLYFKRYTLANRSHKTFVVETLREVIPSNIKRPCSHITLLKI